jgi:MFS family permease
MGAGFRRLVVASGFSNLADGVFQVALPLITLGVTRDPAAFTTVTVALKLPWLLFALPAGALADRLDRRRTMVLVNAGRGVLIGGLAAVVATSGATLWLLVLVALALGVGETLFDTAAMSIVPNLVGRDELSQANGRLFAVELTTNQFVGPPLGGLIVGVTAAGALGSTAGAYALGALTLALIAGSFRPVRDGPPTRLRQDIVEGVRYLFGHRLLRTLALLTGIQNLAFTAALAVLPLHAVDPAPMGLSEAGYGVLITLLAIGAVVGAPLVPPLERRIGRPRALLLALVGASAVWAVPGLTASAVVVGVAFLPVGALTIVWNVITVSLRQSITPDHLLGRMNAGYRLLAWGAQPLGAALGGQLGGLLDVQAVFLLAAAGSLSAAPLLLAVVTEKAITEAERPTEPAAPARGPTQA